MTIYNLKCSLIFNFIKCILLYQKVISKAGDAIRTRDVLHGKQTLYHWVTPAFSNIIILYLFYLSIFILICFFSRPLTEHFRYLTPPLCGKAKTGGGGHEDVRCLTTYRGGLTAPFFTGYFFEPEEKGIAVSKAALRFKKKPELLGFHLFFGFFYYPPSLPFYSGSCHPFFLKDAAK